MLFTFAYFSIGYARIIFAGLAVHSMANHPKYCALLYCISAILDVADGMAARAFNQTSKLGGVLDMVTDRLVLLTFIIVTFFTYTYI